MSYTEKQLTSVVVSVGLQPILSGLGTRVPESMLLLIQRCWHLIKKGINILVMCDADTPAGEPIPTNKRHNAAKIFSHPDVVAESFSLFKLQRVFYGMVLNRNTLCRKRAPICGYPGPQLSNTISILVVCF